MIDLNFFAAITTIRVSIFTTLFVFCVLTNTRENRFELFTAQRAVTNCDIGTTMVEVRTWFFYGHVDRPFLAIFKIDPDYFRSLNGRIGINSAQRDRMSNYNMSGLN